MRFFTTHRSTFASRVFSTALLAACALSTHVAPQAAAAPVSNSPTTNPSFGIVRAAPKNDGATATAALFRYQQALDLLSEGKVTQAREAVEAARRIAGNTPELNLLLGYLLQREGRAELALSRLHSVSARSALASAYVAQLDRESIVAGVDAVPADAVLTDAVLTDDVLTDDVQAEMNADSGNDVQQTAAGAASPGDTLIVAGTIASFKQNNKSLAALERSLLRRVNAERTSRGLIALTWDEKLSAVARAHSLDMRDKKYFAHESSNKSLREPLDRYRAVFGRTPRIVAENVYRSWGSPRTLGENEIAAAHDALMKSPGHRSNILLQGVTHIGIGLISNPNGDLWVTEMFSRPQ